MTDRYLLVQIEVIGVWYDLWRDRDASRLQFNTLGLLTIIQLAAAQPGIKIILEYISPQAKSDNILIYIFHTWWWRCRTRAQRSSGHRGGSWCYTQLWNKPCHLWAARSTAQVHHLHKDNRERLLLVVLYSYILSTSFLLLYVRFYLRCPAVQVCRE